MNMSRTALIILWLIAIGTAVSAAAGHDNSVDEDPYCPLTKNDVLNVHLVPHTHDDVGWLKTVDQYYYGLNNTIQKAHVKLILDNVLTALLDTNTKHNRTFTYVEMKFFSKWYTDLSDIQKQALKHLIKKKQFSFANGGWCMHDEAATHFMGQIDQTTLGHAFLKKELDVVPSVGWQIDPFGHSATQGGLLSSGVGFDALYFGRIHYADLEHRKREAECEGLWTSSSVEAEGDSSVFWGLTGSYGGNYGGPKGFCFDPYCGNAKKQILVDLPGDVLLGRIKNFTNLVAIQANQTKGNNLMLTMGMDFFYSEAGTNFQNLDLLIEATRRFLKDGSIKVTDVFGPRFSKVNVFYSTPERYTNCKYVDATLAKRSGRKDSLKDGIPTKYDPASWASSPKTGDFFPYADCDHCYWAGYFSSRQSLKRMERVGSSFLHAARQVESIAKLSHAHVSLGEASSSSSDNSWNQSPLYSLDDAMGVAQHHDCVTGTSKQHVAYDYAKRISQGISDASLFVTTALRKLLLGPSSSSTMLDNLSYCHLLNETICEVSQAASKDANKIIYVVVYNALASVRSEAIHLPIDSAATYNVEKILAAEWSAVTSNLLPNPNYTRSSAAAGFTLIFKADELPPLGASVFRISKIASGNNVPLQSVATGESQRNIPLDYHNINAYDSLSEDTVNGGGDMPNRRGEDRISNGVLSVSFDSSTGVMKSISEQREGGVTVNVKQEYGYYKAFYHEDSPNETYAEATDGLNDQEGVCLRNEMPWLKLAKEETEHQNAGAYILRPTPDQSFVALEPKAVPYMVVFYESDLITEVHAQFGDWVTQIIRLIQGKDYVEIDYIVGQVPIDDGVGKEIISRYSTSIESNGTFYTDSNGREFMKRKRFDKQVFGYDNPEDYDTNLEPIAGNYFPVNAAIYIEDENKSFSILTDRSQGGTSLSDGSLELLIQRRLLYDDARGVGEPLNETDVGITPNQPYGNATRLGKGVLVKGTQRLKIGKNGGARQARLEMDKLFSQPHVFVASAPKTDGVPFHTASLSLLNDKPLPDNVMVLTFASIDDKDNTFLVRLAHQYGKDEDESQSMSTHVDMENLFPNQDIVSVTEKTLSGNQDRSDWEKKRLRWDDNELPYVRPQNAHIVVLKPLEIRTFEVHVSLSKSSTSSAWRRRCTWVTILFTVAVMMMY